MTTRCAVCGAEVRGYGTRVVCSGPCLATLEKQDQQRLAAAGRSPSWTGYPAGWPACIFCGEPALDGHLTCGCVACDEAAARDRAGGLR